MTQRINNFKIGSLNVAYKIGFCCNHLCRWDAFFCVRFRCKTSAWLAEIEMCSGKLNNWFLQSERTDKITSLFSESSFVNLLKW